MFIGLFTSCNCLHKCIVYKSGCRTLYIQGPGSQIGAETDNIAETYLVLPSFMDKSEQCKAVTHSRD